jgi:hypothetical protein
MSGLEQHLLLWSPPVLLAKAVPSGRLWVQEMREPCNDAIVVRMVPEVEGDTMQGLRRS